MRNKRRPGTWRLIRDARTLAMLTTNTVTSAMNFTVKRSSGGNVIAT